MNTERELRMIAGMRARRIAPHVVRNKKQAKAIARIDHNGRVWRPGDRYYVFCTAGPAPMAEYIQIVEKKSCEK